MNSINETFKRDRITAQTDMRHRLKQTTTTARSARLLILVATMLSQASFADRVNIAFTLDSGFIETLLTDRVFTGSGQSLRLNDNGTGCQYLKLSEPSVTTQPGQVVILTKADARAGRAVGDRCLLLVNWQGRIEFTQEPVVSDNGRSMVLRTTSWRALRPDNSTDALSTTIGGWLEQFLPVDLRQTRVDLAQPISQLAEFLGLIITPASQDNMLALINSLAVDGVTVDSEGARVTLGMDAPLPLPAALQPEPLLSDNELELLQQKLGSVDAFFTFTIKALSRNTETIDPDAMFELLVELRRELIAILSNRQRQATDPTRGLFVRAWTKLLPTLQQISDQQSDQQNALQFLTFIGAGDVLRALDELGPATGIDISSDGLRRLARILIPTEIDPLLLDDAVDPELRESLGFGPPVPPPQASINKSLLDWLIPSAVAATSLDPAVVKRLNNWVPKPTDMNTYLPMVRDVLRSVVAEQLRSSQLEGGFREVYRTLVFTAAWQESCWRQFVAQNKMRVPMQSSTGDLGIMQINPSVWRGLYDLHGLRWDIVYNARSGADILEHHMINYAIKHREHLTTGSLDNLARSTYSAYNGGPRQFDRYRRKNAGDRDKKVDGLFFEKYRQVKSGNELGVKACYGI